MNSETNSRQALEESLRQWDSLAIKQCGLVRHFPEGAKCFRQRDLWSFHFYHYHGSLESKGEQWDFAPGAASLIPPGRPVAWRFPRVALHHYVHFSVYPKTGNPGVLLAGLPAAGQWLREDLDFMVEHSRQHPRAAELRFHNLLWRLALADQEVTVPEPTASSTLQIALSLIRNEMDRGIKVAEIARHCGVSRGHLNRLFHQSFGQSTQAYLQQKRIDLIRSLLAESEEPIIAVAAQAGFDDLQAFNKFVRRNLGAAPRLLRMQSPSIYRVAEREK